MFHKNKQRPQKSLLHKQFKTFFVCLPLYDIAQGRLINMNKLVEKSTLGGFFSCSRQLFLPSSISWHRLISVPVWWMVSAFFVPFVSLLFDVNFSRIILLAKRKKGFHVIRKKILNNFICSQFLIRMINEISWVFSVTPRSTRSVSTGDYAKRIKIFANWLRSRFSFSVSIIFWAQIRSFRFNSGSKKIIAEIGS